MMHRMHRSWWPWLLLFNGIILIAIFVMYLILRNSLWKTPKPIIASLQLPENYQRLSKSSGQSKLNYVDISIEKPIFYMNRKMPDLPDIKINTLPKDQWESAQLLGIYRGSVSGAILFYGGMQKRLSVEEELDGWSLKNLYSDYIEIENKGLLRKIDLKKADVGQK